MYFEDVVPGERNPLGTHTFTKEEILAFGRAFDPQPFHVDEAAASKSHFGGLIASGWHVAAIWMKLNVARLEALGRQAAASGAPVGRLGPSPGFRNMVWARPVRPGDTLAYFITVTDKKVSASRPGWGIVMIHNEAHDQAGNAVFAFDGAVFWERRPS